jgi:hypothetical protein
MKKKLEKNGKNKNNKKKKVRKMRIKISQLKKPCTSL